MKEKQSAPITDGQKWTMQFYLFWYCGTIKYRNIWVIITNSFAPHKTTLYYFLFYVRCQDMCLRGYSVATVYCQYKVLFIYPLINLSSKKTMQNRYSINLTFLNYEYNWIRLFINWYKKVFLVGWCWNRITWNVIRHLKSDCKIFVAKLSLDVLWISTLANVCKMSLNCRKIVIKCFVNLAPDYFSQHSNEKHHDY